MNYKKHLIEINPMISKRQNLKPNKAVIIVMRTMMVKEPSQKKNLKEIDLMKTLA